MLWSPNEVLAYLKDDLNLQNSGNDKKDEIFCKKSAFGGFSTWLSQEIDFVFIAENSEIYGPNPLFTIPCEPKGIDLNFLATRILSADYQGLSSKKSVSLTHAQLIMPDISKEIHAVVNYFLLFDTEARGFIRPTCIAYITSDKYKLICLSETILKSLSEASMILQHSNMVHVLGDLKAMVQDINNPFENLALSEVTLKKKIADDVTKDIQDIVDAIENYQGNVMIDKQILTILEMLKKTSLSPEINKLLNIPKPQEWKRKNDNLHKCMKNLYFICGSGLVLGLYHLFVIHKHFRRKYENLYLSKTFSYPRNNDERLYFGACVKTSNLNNIKYPSKECILTTDRFEEVPSIDSEQYFLFLDTSFEKTLLEFLTWERNNLQDYDHSNSLLQSSNISDTSTDPESLCSASSGYLSSEYEISDCDIKKNCGHIVTLEDIWDVLEDLKKENPDIESAFLEIIKLFDDTQKLLFSLLTRTPIIIISTPEEKLTAQKFIRAVSIFIPRRKDEVIFVDIDRHEPLAIEHFQYIAAANVCLDNQKTVEEIIPHHFWQSLCILNLRDFSLTAPAYMGVLLSNIDERFRILSLQGPAFPIIVGILCDVQSAVNWWLMLTLPSFDDSAASSSILQKGYSRWDVQILWKLAKLCRS